MNINNIKRSTKRQQFSIGFDPVKFQKLKKFMKEEEIKMSDFFDEVLNQVLKGK